LNISSRKRATKWEALERGIRALILEKKGRSSTEISKTINVDITQVSGILENAREYPRKIADLNETVEREGLIDYLEDEKREAIKIGQRTLQTKIRGAKAGYHQGPAPLGYRNVKGVLVPNEKAKVVKGVLEGFLYEYKSPKELAEEFKLARYMVYRILRNPVYAGRFTFAGKPYKGNWEPLITPEELDEIQSITPHRRVGVTPSGCRWKDRKFVLTPEGREKYETICKLRLQGKTIEGISKDVGWSANAVRNAFMSGRMRGLVGEERWEALQKISVPDVIEEMKRRGKETDWKILSSLPAFRWELERLRMCEETINTHVKGLKEEGRLKEREDGLLQRGWEEFPGGPLIRTRFQRLSKNREKIMEVLDSLGVGEEVTPEELAQKVGLKYHTLYKYILRLRREGLLGEREKLIKGLGEKKREVVEGKILSFMRDQKWIIREVAEGTGLDRHTVSNHLRRLAGEGRAENIPPENKSKSAVPFPSKWRIKTE